VSRPLLERLTIALVGVLLVSALVGWINYDMQRTAASRPADSRRHEQRTNRSAQLMPVSGCPAAMTPTLTVADLLGRVARFQLAQRVVDRRKGHRDAVVL
jgi:hypothetical protein